MFHVKHSKKKHMFTNMIYQLINSFDYVSSLNRFTPLDIKQLHITFFYGRTSINYMKL